MKVICALFGKTAPIENIAEVFFQWSPQIAVSHEAIFLEVSRCQKLYKSQEIISKLYQVCEAYDQKPWISEGPDIPSSLALARFRLTDKEQLPIAALRDYLSPFHYDQSVEGLLNTLEKLGLHSLRSFLLLPPRALPQRLGRLGLVLRQRVIDASHLPWPYLRPKEVLSEEHLFEFTDRVQSLEPLLFALNKLTERLLLRLKARGRAITQVELKLQLEPTSLTEQKLRSWCFDFPLPQIQAKNILDILRDKLGFDLQKNPLKALVQELSLQVRETAPLPSAQKDFFFKKEEQQEAWASLVARLAEKLGPPKVFTAQLRESHRPEKAWQSKEKLQLNQLPTETKPSKLPDRPLRLFTTQYPLEQLGDFVIFNQHRWRVLEWEGPEHISGEWWTKEDFHREYFKLSTDKGEDLWVYRKPGTEQLYLHGLFD